MRKMILPLLTALVCLFALCGCAVEPSSLPDISRPYVGMYECEELSMGGEDMMEKFEFVRLELGYGGEFRLVYRTASGNEGGYSGTYKMTDKDITLTVERGILHRSFTFPVVEGGILIDYNLQGKLLHAKFKMK